MIHNGRSGDNYEPSAISFRLHSALSGQEKRHARNQAWRLVNSAEEKRGLSQGLPCDLRHGSKSGLIPYRQICQDFAIQADIR